MKQHIKKQSTNLGQNNPLVNSNCVHFFKLKVYKVKKIK